MKTHRILYTVAVILLVGCSTGKKDFNYREAMFDITEGERSSSSEDHTSLEKENKTDEESLKQNSVSDEEEDKAKQLPEKIEDKEVSEEKKEIPASDSPSEKIEKGPTEEEKGDANSENISSPFEHRKLESDYSQYSNESFSWWYHVPKPLNEGVPAKINKEVKTLIEKYDALWQYSTGEKKIYWTMDEGYEFENNTTTILNVAKEKEVPITFFVTGDFIRQRPDLLQRMDAEGHLICNHSNKHLNPPKALAESDEKWIRDVTVVEEMVRNITGKDMQPFFRPPEGGYSERTLQILKDLGYRAVFWSFAYKDWETKNQPSKEYAKEKILGQLHDGSILLVHAVSKTNVEVFSELIDEIRKRGYSFDTIDHIPFLSPDGY